MPLEYISTCTLTGIVREPPRFFGDNHTGGHVQTFVLPEGRCVSSLDFQFTVSADVLSRGRIHHIQHNSMAPQEQVDVLFETYQKQASTGILPFRRWPLRSVSFTYSESLRFYEIPADIA